jgi:hypothetical protein
MKMPSGRVEAAQDWPLRIDSVSRRIDLVNVR